MDREPLRDVTDQELHELAERAGRALLAAGLHIVTAESCTGGWIAKALTDIPGSSQWLECGYVTYSNAAKERDLAVPGEVLNGDGAVSEATVRHMARGALKVSGAQLAVSVSGIAGPDGATPGKPVGTVWFGMARRAAGHVEDSAYPKLFAGDRDQVRRQSVAFALRLVLDAAVDASGGGDLQQAQP